MQENWVYMFFFFKGEYDKGGFFEFLQEVGRNFVMVMYFL